MTNFTEVNWNTVYYQDKYNATEVFDKCVSTCKTRTFMVLLLIFVLTLAEIIIYKLKFNESSKQRLLEYIIMIRNIVIIVLFVYEFFFFVLY